MFVGNGFLIKGNYSHFYGKKEIEMVTEPCFYSVIIGTELLNGRRQDGHFSFVNDQLVARGWVHKASFVIKDDPQFLHDIFSLIKADPDSVMFSFGGIGSTPDDFTREVAAKAFTGHELERHKEAETIIVDRIGRRAFPHPIKPGVCCPPPTLPARLEKVIPTGVSP